MYGLLDKDLKLIAEAVGKYSEIEEVVLFGSRAMGNYKKGSDIDLAIVGEKTDRKIIRRLSEDLNENYPLPYFIDVVCYKDISNEELKKHIDSVGKIIYKRDQVSMKQ